MYFNPRSMFEQCLAAEVHVTVALQLEKIMMSSYLMVVGMEYHDQDLQAVKRSRHLEHLCGGIKMEKALS